MTDSPTDDLRALLDEEGRVTRWPARRALQAQVLNYLAARFEPGRQYTEKEVNALLNGLHTFGDAALLRRELFELGLLNREKDGSVYWRALRTKLF